MTAPVLVGSAEGIHRRFFLWGIRIDGQVLLLYLPQFVFPGSFSAFHTLHRELAAQRGVRVCRPHYLANGFVASTLDRDQVPNFYVTKAEQARATGMNIVGTCHLRTATLAILHVGETHRQGPVEQ